MSRRLLRLLEHLLHLEKKWTGSIAHKKIFSVFFWHSLWCGNEFISLLYIRTPLPLGFRNALLCCREYEILLCCLFSLQDSISASLTKSCFPPRSIYPETLLSAGVRICWEAICLLFQATRTPPPLQAIGADSVAVWWSERRRVFARPNWRNQWKRSAIL